jgi:hypothetical protein
MINVLFLHRKSWLSFLWLIRKRNIYYFLNDFHHHYEKVSLSNKWLRPYRNFCIFSNLHIQKYSTFIQKKSNIVYFFAVSNILTTNLDIYSRDSEDESEESGKREIKVTTRMWARERFVPMSNIFLIGFWLLNVKKKMPREHLSEKQVSWEYLLWIQIFLVSQKKKR